MTFGPYEIISPIGSGGMAEVFKARDTRLDRTVAIKVLHGRFSERFEREARAISALNHPHICTLYDVGQQDDTSYLVMEYVEGRPLKGPLPLREALRLAIQMADALDHAHRRGVFHRDLKPANVLVGKSGAKLLDFGVARIAQSRDEMEAADATRTMKLTAEGTVVGTYPYMAPELLEGREADARSDIFAFGAVLFETITGRRAFDGTSPRGVMTAIMTSDPPPVSSIEPSAPPALDRVVSRCMAKDPDRRWQTAADLRDELNWIAEPTTPTAATGLPALKRGFRAGWWVPVGAVALAALAALAAWLLAPERAQELPLRRFTFARDQNPSNAVISPDGRHVAYQVGPAGRSAIWIQDLDRDEPREIVAIGPNALPFWSPGSDWIGFFAETELKRVSVHGGAAVTVCKLPGEVIAGAVWSGDGRSIVFSCGGPPRIHEVPAQGGTPRVLVRPAESEASQNFVDPQFLPGDTGRRVLLFAIGGASRPYRFVLQELGTERRTVLGSGRRPVYSPTGHILSEDRNRLWALPFALERLSASGPPFPIQENGEFPSVSTDGTLTFVGGRSSVPEHLVWKDRNGQTLGVIGQPQDRIYTPMLSPDGNRVAVWGRESDNDDIWVHDAARNLKIRVTSHPAWEDRPIWFPDGRRLAFSSNRSGNADIFMQAADGGGEAEELLGGVAAQYPEDWSPDGKYLICDFIGDRRRDLWYLRRAEGRTEFEAVPFLVTEFDEGEPNFSPDGRFVAYSSDESGRREVYIRSFPAGGVKVQVSTHGGGQPRWRGDGSELFYVEGETLMTVAVTAGLGLRVGPAQVLFEHMGIARRPGQQYDVSADGKRFVLIEPVGGPPRPFISVVQNWFAGFRERTKGS